MKEMNPYLQMFYDTMKPNLTKAFASIVSCTVSDIDEFEAHYIETITDMDFELFEHIKEGWFHTIHRKNESRKLRYTIEYLLWYNNNIGAVRDLQDKVCLLENTKEYFEYQDSHYWGLFLKNFDELYNVANRSYVEKVPENIRNSITADVLVVGMIICYSSGLWSKSVDIKMADVSNDYTKFSYEGKTYKVCDDGVPYLKLYCQQDSVITNGNKPLYKNDGEYLMKYLVKQGQVEEKYNKVYQPNYLNNKLRLLNNEYHSMYPDLFRNVKFTPDSIYLSGYLNKALSILPINADLNDWRKYVNENPISNHSISEIITLKDIYLSQTI